MKSNVKRANTKNVTHQQWMQDHPYQQPKTTHFSRIKKEDASFYFRQTSKNIRPVSSSSRMKPKSTAPIPVWNDRFHRDDIDESGPLIHRRRPSSSTAGPKINADSSTLSVAEVELGAAKWRSALVRNSRVRNRQVGGRIYHRAISNP